jgi:GT2 family glycosyltransferase
MEMTMSSSLSGPALLTPGKLPLEPFRHREPTAMALLDLEVGAVSILPDATSASPRCRDALVLVRLHGEPLGILYADRSPDELGARELTELVWTHCEAEIRRHFAEAACGIAPSGPADLVEGLGDATGCRDKVVPQTVGSIAVVVSTLGQSILLPRCLAALGSMEGPDYEVVIVHNGAPDTATRRIVEVAAGASAHPIRYVEEPRLGVSLARNRGTAETAADIVLFTDDDVVVDRDWLRWLVEPFTRADVGATAGMLLPLELQTPAQKRFEQYAGLSRGLARRSFDLTRNRADDRLLYPFWGGVFGSGASIGFRRESFVASGGFDPTLGSGTFTLSGEDHDAMSAAVLRGQRLVYEPRSVCWHANRRGDDALRRQVFTYSAGFTAILTKALLHDPRFLAAAARSVPVVLETRRRYRDRRSSDPAAVRLTPELARLERRGMATGPARYVWSAFSTRRRGLRTKILGG